MVLSDRSIKEALEQGRLIIEPTGDDCIQPSSVDVHVDQHFRVFRNHSQRVIDVREAQEDLTELIDVGHDTPMILHPGEFMLGSTTERVALPDDLVGRLDGKSSLIRERTSRRSRSVTFTGYKRWC
jgi:dCTP deaminase